MSKTYHTCTYSGSQVRPITNSDIQKAIGKTSSKTPNIILNKSKYIEPSKKIK